MWRRVTLVWITLVLSPCVLTAQDKSVARQWNEILLEGIRNDYARPTVHARNLFHVSAAMFDAWAVFEDGADPYFLGNTIDGYLIPFEGFDFDPSLKGARQQEAISYAAYHLMNHRFQESPDFEATKWLMDSLFTSLGYSTEFYDNDYSSGSAAALGIYIAEQVKFFGYQDGANERGNYENLFYEPVNEPLDLFAGGDNIMNDPNRWQPLQFGNEPVIDQSGNVIEGGIVDFLSPEWGEVVPFAMTDGDRTTHTRDGYEYHVYMDPGGPPQLDTTEGNDWEDPFKWNFGLVSVWSSQLDPGDGVMWDISPGGLGNLSIDDLPLGFSSYDEFYDLLNGGDPGTGFNMNPVTGQPYTPQLVPRGDYARVLAEFWADGPDSETPPGHWFVLLNYVLDQPELEKRFGGSGPVLNNLEYDVKAYFILGGAMHDAAIASWSIKGYYDYVRPVSAIRYMATMGQSTDAGQPNYNPAGIPLLEGYIELIEEGDPLAGPNNENLHEIKLMAWRGHDFIQDPEVDQAGVGWILATEWWPYQRPSFVTPPFAGYISGHSTYSRAAAEVLTALTGDPYFPGGMGEFHAKRNEFLVFEEGPNMDITLQWARYTDASDQCSLSRIWGGIHPPADDLNGRRIGKELGQKAFDFAQQYFSMVVGLEDVLDPGIAVYPNPVKDIVRIRSSRSLGQDYVRLSDLQGRVWDIALNQSGAGDYLIDMTGFSAGIYILQIEDNFHRKIVVQH